MPITGFPEISKTSLMQQKVYKDFKLLFTVCCFFQTKQTKQTNNVLDNADQMAHKLVLPKVVGLIPPAFIVTSLTAQHGR